MEPRPPSPFPAAVAAAILLAGLLLVGAFFIPWQGINWGKVELTPAQTVTVIGSAENQQASQIARFTAGVNRVNDSKEEAVNQVNEKVAELIQKVKDFGIPAEDIKTQNISVYQQEETYYEEGRQKSRLGQWRVSNSIEITLRDVDKASQLADLLSASGATSVSGPNFSISATAISEPLLLKDAIKDAKDKAEAMASASGRSLGKILSVSESGSLNIYPVLRGEGIGGGGAPVEPGTNTVSKSVTVTFELK